MYVNLNRIRANYGNMFISLYLRTNAIKGISRVLCLIPFFYFEIDLVFFSILLPLKCLFNFFLPKKCFGIAIPHPHTFVKSPAAKIRMKQ
jgi:hypothetical protein